MLPKFKPSFIGFSLQSVIHIKIDSNTSISKRSNTRVNKRIVGINAFHLKTSCFAFSFSVSHPAPHPHPRPGPCPCLQKDSGVPPVQKLLLHGGGLALAASGCFATVLLCTFEKQRPPVAEVFSRLEYRNVCVATWSLFHCLTWRAMGRTLLNFPAQLP